MKLKEANQKSRVVIFNNLKAMEVQEKGKIQELKNIEANSPSYFNSPLGIAVLQHCKIIEGMS